jgi:hypothetical protein
VDWGALLGVMAVAAQQGRDPFTDAVRVQERLFTTRPIFLGVEESMRHPQVPCALRTDPERARHVRRRIREMINSRGEWETTREWIARPLDEIFVPEKHEGAGATTDDTVEGTPPRLVPALSVPASLEKVGVGSLCVLSEQPRVYGRCVTVAERVSGDRVVIAKWVRRLTNWNGRQATAQAWQEQIAPLVARRLADQRTDVVRFTEQERRILAQVSIGKLTMKVAVDAYGVGLWHPTTREVLPYDCAQCSLVEVCRGLSAATGTAMLWRRLGLVDTAGAPTLRGRLVSFFSQGDGLAIAVALEDETYPLEELIYDLANLDAGFRFCGEDNRWGGRLATVCHERFGLQSVPGYLENGVPPKYGAGAEQVVAAVHKNPLNKHAWISDLLGPGDIDRVIIEWRSLLRQIAHAPELEWPRWGQLQVLARSILNETTSPTLTDLPPLEFHQTRRVDHRLILRWH